MEEHQERQPDIKGFILHLNQELEKVEKGMHASKQEYEQLRNEARNLEVHNQEESNDITNRTLDDIEKIEREFKNLVSEEKSELSFLKQQMAALTQEKMKLEQNCLLIGTRVDEVERSVGIEIVLPNIEKSK